MEPTTEALSQLSQLCAIHDWVGITEVGTTCFTMFGASEIGAMTSLAQLPLEQFQAVAYKVQITEPVDAAAQLPGEFDASVVDMVWENCTSGSWQSHAYVSSGTGISCTSGHPTCARVEGGSCRQARRHTMLSAL